MRCKRKGLESLHPVQLPTQQSKDPAKQEGWCFPDTEQGILDVVRQAATHLWANTILFASHPLQTSHALREYGIYVVGQPPVMVEKFDDKAYLNDKLCELGSFTMPQFWMVGKPEEIRSFCNLLKG